jgi:hypothetical protein
MKFIDCCLFAILIFCGGCLPNVEGGYVTVFDGYARPTVYGGDGTSYETALYIRNIPKDSLTINESHWVYFKYCDNSGMQLPTDDAECSRIMPRVTERHGKRVYDILTVKTPDGQIHVVYFDVTNYRYFWPKDN